MVDVPRFDQERHLRAIVPEWLTRPPEHELMRRELAAREAAEERRIARVERAGRIETVRNVALLALAVQAVCTGTALVPLVAALALGVALGVVVHALGEGVVTWGVTSILLGCAAATWSHGATILLIVTPCAAGMVGAVVGILRDPAFRI